MIALITGSLGLLGSEAVAYFSSRCELIIGIDSSVYTGSLDSSMVESPVLQSLKLKYRNYIHRDVDIRDVNRLQAMFKVYPIDLVIHAASYPLSANGENPADLWSVGATGTFNLLEAVRKYRPECTFVYISSSKVYGRNPDRMPVVEHRLRYDYPFGTKHYSGVNESTSLDRTAHGMFGLSKLAADQLVQEYGRLYEIKSACLRMGSVAGGNKHNVYQRGFVHDLVRAAVRRKPYTVRGYGGKQVRDVIHAFDVADFIGCFAKTPRCAAVYNIGGGRDNSMSILEAVAKINNLSGYTLRYAKTEIPRKPECSVYISDLSRAKSDCLEWKISWSLDKILAETIKKFVVHFP